MALINSESSTCTKIIKTQIDDGEGGQTTVYVDDVTFDAVIAPTGNSDLKVIANKDISAQAIRVFYPNSITLDLNDVFKVGTQCYKVVQSGFKSARAASVQHSLAYAEKWEVPPDEYSE